MINPNRYYYVGVVSKMVGLQCDDLYNLTHKYAFDEPLQVWAQYSICLEKFILRKVRRAPKRLIK